MPLWFGIFTTHYLLKFHPSGIIEFDKKFENPCYILKTDAAVGFKDQRAIKMYYGDDLETRQLTGKNIYTVSNAGAYSCFEVTYTYEHSDEIYKYYIHPVKGIVKITLNSSLYRCFWILSAGN